MSGPNDTRGVDTAVEAALRLTTPTEPTIVKTVSKHANGRDNNSKPRVKTPPHDFPIPAATADFAASKLVQFISVSH